MQKTTADPGYIKAVRSVESVITFKKEYIKLLTEEIKIHESEKEYFIKKHEEVLQKIEEIDPTERNETNGEVQGIGKTH